MGKRFELHDGLCGCERCAMQYESDTPRQVFDVIEDPNYLDCGCRVGECDCAQWDYGDDYGDED